MTAGDDPSGSHPAGTVYVVEPLEAFRGQTISEWDLAEAKALRRRELPFDPGNGWPRVLHRGDAVHLVSSSREGMYYTLLDASFRVVSRQRLEELNRASAALASDGTITVVLGVVTSYDGAPGGIDAYAATFDAHGKRLAGRKLQYGPGALGGSTVLGDVAAVAGGTPYILGFDGGTLRLHELTPDLREVTSTIVPVGPRVRSNLSTLRARGDRLVVDVPPQQFEYSLDLTEVREVPRRPPRSPRPLDETALEDAALGEIVECSQSATLGPIYALCCDAFRRDEHTVQFIAWDRRER